MAPKRKAIGAPPRTTRSPRSPRITRSMVEANRARLTDSVDDPNAIGRGARAASRREAQNAAPAPSSNSRGSGNARGRGNGRGRSGRGRGNGRGRGGAAGAAPTATEPVERPASDPPAGTIPPAPSDPPTPTKQSGAPKRNKGKKPQTSSRPEATSSKDKPTRLKDASQNPSKTTGAPASGNKRKTGDNDNGDQQKEKPKCGAGESSTQPEQPSNPCDELPGLIVAASAELQADKGRNYTLPDQPLDFEVVWRAIATVTEAIAQREDGPRFMLAGPGDWEVALAGQAPGNIARVGEEAIIPWTLGGHTSLFILGRNETGVFTLRHYDTANSNPQHRNARVATGRQIERVLMGRGWPQGQVFPQAVDANHLGRQQQGTNDCGLYIVAFGWAYALGLDFSAFIRIIPDQGAKTLTGDRMAVFRERTLALIGLALEGYLSSEIISAYLRCFGFVPRDAQIPGNRSFERTHPLLSSADLTERVFMIRSEERTDGEEKEGNSTKNRSDPAGTSNNAPPQKERNYCDEYRNAVAVEMANGYDMSEHMDHPAREGQMLQDETVFSAIASVTEAISARGTVQFSLLDSLMPSYARSSPAQFAAAQLARPGRDVFLPYIPNDVHSSLYHFHVREGGHVNIFHYDSVSGAHPSTRDRALRRMAELQRVGWMSNQQGTGTIMRVTAQSSQQRGGWECGLMVIANAWAIALGLRTTGREWDEAHLANAVHVVNMALTGGIGSSTIEAFLKCIGHVYQDSDVSEDRTFEQTMGFPHHNDLGNQIVRVRLQEELTRLQAETPNALRTFNMDEILRILQGPHLRDVPNLRGLTTTFLRWMLDWHDHVERFESGDTSESPDLPDWTRPDELSTARGRLVIARAALFSEDLIQHMQATGGLEPEPDQARTPPPVQGQGSPTSAQKARTAVSGVIGDDTIAEQYEAEHRIHEEVFQRSSREVEEARNNLATAEARLNNDRGVRAAQRRLDAAEASLARARENLNENRPGNVSPLPVCLPRSYGSFDHLELTGIMQRTEERLDGAVETTETVDSQNRTASRAGDTTRDELSLNPSPEMIGNAESDKSGPGEGQDAVDARDRLLDLPLSPDFSDDPDLANLFEDPVEDTTVNDDQSASPFDSTN